MQVFLDTINIEDELFLDSYLKALKNNDSKVKENDRGGEAHFRSGLNTQHARLFIGKMRKKKPRKDPIGLPTPYTIIFSPQRARHLRKKEEKQAKKISYGTQVGSLCAWAFTSIKRAQACKQKEESKYKKSDQGIQPGASTITCLCFS